MVATPTETDGGVAFLNAWAKIADIIAFYQERVADEERLSTRNELSVNLLPCRARFRHTVGSSTTVGTDKP